MSDPEIVDLTEVAADDALVDVIAGADDDTLAALQRSDWRLACLLAEWVADVRF